MGALTTLFGVVFALVAVLVALLVQLSDTQLFDGHALYAGALQSHPRVFWGPQSRPEARELHGRRVLITGAATTVGANVVREFLSQGWYVYAVVDADDAVPKSFMSFPNAENLHLFRSQNGTWGLIDSFPPACNVIVHTAVDEKSAWFRRNVNGVVDQVLALRKLLNSAFNRGVEKFVFVSSVAARIPRVIDAPVTEQTDFGGSDKLFNGVGDLHELLEREVDHANACGLQTVILEHGQVVGAHSVDGAVALSLSICRGEVPFFASNVVPFTDAAELGRAAFAAAGVEAGSGETYIIVTDNRPWARFFELTLQSCHRGKVALEKLFEFNSIWSKLIGLRGLIFELTGRGDDHPLCLPQAHAKRMFLEDVRVDAKKAVSRLGLKAVPLETSLQAQMKYLDL